MGEQLTLIAESDIGHFETSTPPTSYVMRACRQSDTPVLGWLYFEAYAPGMASATLDEAVVDIRASFDGEYGELWREASLLIEYGEELAAAILTVRRAPWEGTPDCPFIIELFTARSHRRRGLARALILRALDAARHAGESEIALRVDADNTAARALYDSLGFRRWDEADD